MARSEWTWYAFISKPLHNQVCGCRIPGMPSIILLHRKTRDVSRTVMSAFLQSQHMDRVCSLHLFDLFDNYFYASREHLEDVWHYHTLGYQTNLTLEEAKAQAFISDHLNSTLKANRVLMPDGTDGLYCEGTCGNYYPFAEAEGKFICSACKLWAKIQ